ncbi:hypothetical protein GCM10020369_46110 [Cryptosporangium minutisporangium]|uniref:Right handed beta helix domain-containing protein n=1 Tax=Cryptosporangium minutisporangium TaxID=113569 RepID=A0ABP6T2H8_9ACTN
MLAVLLVSGLVATLPDGPAPRSRPAPGPAENPLMAEGPPVLPEPGSGRSPAPSRADGPPCPTGQRVAASPVRAPLTVGPRGRFRTIQAAVDAATAGDTIEIAGGTYREVVTIRRSGRPGAPLTVRARAGERVTLDGRGALPATSGSARGLITLDGRQYVRLSGLTVTNSRRHGIYAGFASHVVVENSEVSYAADGGILIGDGSDVVLTCNRVHHNNAAARTGNIGAAANEGITLFNVRDFTIAYNRVYANDEEGIDVKNGTRGGAIHHNDVYGNNGPNVYVDGASDVRIHSNRIYGARGPTKAGIGLAVESGGTARGVDIYNNVIYGNPGGGVDFWIGHYADVQVFHNTIYRNGRAAIRAIGGAASDSAARGNIAYGNPLPRVPGFVLESNLTADPKFVDLTRGDVRLRRGSAAIDAGSRKTAPATDITGAARPAGVAPDLGAYEFR